MVTTILKGSFGIICIFIFTVSITYAQQATNIIAEIRQSFQRGDYAAVINLCEQQIKNCMTSSPPNYCRFNDVMWKIYEYKGFSEYKLWEKEKNKTSLANAVSSFQKCQELYNAPTVSFNLGVFEMDLSILEKQGSDLKGIVDAWRGIVAQHSENSLKVDNQLLQNIKTFLSKVETLTITPPDSAHTPGDFAGFMVQMACDLALSADLSTDEKKIYESHRDLASKDGEKLRSNLWWSKANEKLPLFEKSSSDSMYLLIDEYLGWATKYAEQPYRKAEVFNERAKLALEMERHTQMQERADLLNKAWEWSKQAYEIHVQHNIELIDDNKNNEILQVYGEAVTRLVKYHAGETEKFTQESLELALLIGNTLVKKVRMPDGIEEYQLNFFWKGREALYYYLRGHLKSMIVVQTGGQMSI